MIALGIGCGYRVHLEQGKKMIFFGRCYVVAFLTRLISWGQSWHENEFC